MPLTPFVGLSVIAHVGVIIGHALFSKRKSQKERVIRRPMLIERLFGLAIIGTIFSIVIVTAVTLVRTSITEKHSSVLFIGRQIKNLEHREPPLPDVAMAQVPIVPESSFNSSALIVNCAPFFQEITRKYHDSLIEYMTGQGYQSSMEYRTRLAGILNISNYQGTANQNKALLQEFCIGAQY